MAENLVVEIAHKIDKVTSKGMVLAQRKGLFVLPEIFIPGDIDTLTSETVKVLNNLNTSMLSGTPPFEKCFFIESTNEKGQTISKEAAIAIVAEFIILNTLSEFSSKMKEKINPYIGIGSAQNSYCTFGITQTYLDSDRVKANRANLLEENIYRTIIENTLKPTLSDEHSYQWILNILPNMDIEEEINDLDDNEVDIRLNQLKEELSSRINIFFSKNQGNLTKLENYLNNLRTGSLQSFAKLMKHIRLLKREIVRLEVKCLFDRPQLPPPLSSPPSPPIWPFIIAICFIIVGGFLAMQISPIIFIPTIVFAGIMIFLGFSIGKKQKAEQPKLEGIYAYRQPAGLFEKLKKKKERLFYLNKIEKILENFCEHLDTSIINSQKIYNAMEKRLENKTPNDREKSTHTQKSSFRKPILDDNDWAKLFPFEINHIMDVTQRFLSKFEISNYLMEKPGGYESEIKKFCDKELDYLNSINVEETLKKKLEVINHEGINHVENYFSNLVNNVATFCQLEPYKSTKNHIIIGLNDLNNNKMKKYFNLPHLDVSFISTDGSELASILQIREGVPLDVFKKVRPYNEAICSEPIELTKEL